MRNEAAKGVKNGKKGKTGLRQTMSSVKSCKFFSKYFDEIIQWLFFHHHRC